MQHQDGRLKGYFAWSCQTDGTRNSEGPASDGELYYVTSLILLLTDGETAQESIIWRKHRISWIVPCKRPEWMQ